MHKSEFGIIGLGVMGKSLSINVAKKGFNLSVYNRSEGNEAHMVSDFLKQHQSLQNISGFTTVEDFVSSLEQPRKILLMVKAGDVVDTVISQLLPHLSKHDIIIDGGNSHYKNTNNRYHTLKEKGIHFIGCGISGGEFGALHGPSIMPGGHIESYNVVAPILESIAAKDKNNKPCCTFIGNDGAGHFVKMIHNGIEYAEMQLLAELYALMQPSIGNETISEVFANWNKTDLSSYLLEITAEILIKKENDAFVLDTILDKAGNKGTGSWSSQIALQLGMPTTMMTSAVFARYISSFKTQRVELSKKVKSKTISNEKIDLKTLEKAYRFARLINHQQGFSIIQQASEEFQWNLNLSEIARIWTSGCIIKSELMQNLSEVFKIENDLLKNEAIFETLESSEASISEIIQLVIKNKIPIDTFWSAYNYWISMTTERLPANLIQAQRDYFGAHTYQKINADTSQYFHTNWTKNS